MRYLNDLYAELISNGDEVICMSADLPDALAAIKTLFGLPYDLWSDPGQGVGRLLLGDAGGNDAKRVTGVVYLNANGEVICKWCSTSGFPTNILAWRAMTAAMSLRDSDMYSVIVESVHSVSDDDQGMSHPSFVSPHKDLTLAAIEPETGVALKDSTPQQASIAHCIILGDASSTESAEPEEASIAGISELGHPSPLLTDGFQSLHESPKRREVLVVDDSKMFSKLASSQLEVT